LTRHYSKNLAVILLNGTVANRRGSEQNESLSSSLSSSSLSSSSYRNVKPALGRLWGETADIHVWLERDPPQQHHHHHQPSVGSTELSTTTTTTIRAVVDRHRAQRRSTGTPSPCWFRLTALGIQDMPTNP
jgi:hypothetical protein